MIRLYFNNKEYTDHADGISSLEITIEADGETGFAAIGISNSLKATGVLYDLIYDTFYADTCKGKDQVLKGSVHISKNECDLEFPVEIRPESIDICMSEGCADFQIKKASSDLDAFDCLKSKVNFWKDNGFQEYIVKVGRAYKILYCNEFGILSWIIWLLFNTLFYPVKLLIDTVCDILNFFGIGDKNGLCKTINSIERQILGCNKYHIATSVRDIFEYNAKLCKLNFDSNLLQYDPVYSCLAIESAIENEGWSVDNCKRADRQYNPGNQENINILQLAVKLVKVINGYAIIRKGKFIFDHISRRYAELTYLFNAEDEYENDRIDSCPTYSVDPSKLYAYIKIEYQPDGLDYSGNKLINEYNETIEWNPNNIRPNNKGQLLVNLDFAPKRLSSDIYVKEGSANMATLAKIRDNGDGGCEFTHAQILSDGQLSLSKLLIIDKVEKINCNGCAFETVVKKNVDFTVTGLGPMNIYDYNYPLKGQELYNKFWSYNDPNGKTARYIEMSELKWRPKNFCDAVNIIFDNNLDVNIESRKYGNGHPSRISINFEVCEITFSGMNYKCEK